MLMFVAGALQPHGLFKLLILGAVHSVKCHQPFAAPAAVASGMNKRAFNVRFDDNDPR
jgi:hypothetical protein